MMLSSQHQDYSSPAYVLSTVPKLFRQAARTTIYKTSTCPFHRRNFNTTKPAVHLQLPTVSLTTEEKEVRTYTKADKTPVDKLATSLAFAFDDDPFFRYVCNEFEGDIVPQNKIFMLSTLNLELSRPDGQSTVHVSEDDSTIAIWRQVNHWKGSFAVEMMFVLYSFRSFGWGAFRMLNFFEVTEHSHPTEPHMYLFIIGTHPSSQRRGNASRVISKMLEYCDREGLPAYLESSNEKNIGFYKKHGFEVVGKIPGFPDECPPITGMWRDPKPLTTI